MKLIGDKKFYIMVLTIAVPIMIQNGITNFVNLLDNIMVGQIGTLQMSGVSVINYLVFVYNVSIFGATSGAGIFTAQYYGISDNEGIRYTFRFKLISCIIIALIYMGIFIIFGDRLILKFLNDTNDIERVNLTLKYAKDYLAIILLILIPNAIAQTYSSTLRECSETLVPMVASIASVLVNLFFNYLLIFGKFGFPSMGVGGAALATFISKIVEMLIVIAWTHKNSDINKFTLGLYKSLRVSKPVAIQILKKGTPLVFNEILWASGTAVLIQCYSYRGLDVVAGLNISSTVYNLFNLVFVALGGAISIIVGQLLGAGKLSEAKDSAYKLIFFSFSSFLYLV